MIVMVVLLVLGLVPVRSLINYFTPIILAFVILLRLTVRRLPKFLRKTSGR
jgi:hypothetical protein